MQNAVAFVQGMAVQCEYKKTGGIEMGGRGSDFEWSEEPENGIPERFAWITDVSTERLRGYVARADHVGGGYDPQGRQIHVVGYYAEIELRRRGEL